MLSIHDEWLIPQMWEPVRGQKEVMEAVRGLAVKEEPQEGEVSRDMIYDKVEGMEEEVSSLYTLKAAVSCCLEK